MEPLNKLVRQMTDPGKRCQRKNYELAAKRFVKRKTETSVTELKWGCCGLPVEVSNTEGISLCGAVSWDTNVLSAVYVRSTRVKMAVDDEEEEWLESGTSRVSCGLQREDEESQLPRRLRKELNSGEQSECAETRVHQRWKRGTDVEERQDSRVSPKTEWDATDAVRG